MCDPAGEKNGEVAENGVCRSEVVHVRVEEITHMVQDHDDHHKAFQDVEGFEATLLWRRGWVSAFLIWFVKHEREVRCFLQARSSSANAPDIPNQMIHIKPSIVHEEMAEEQPWTNHHPTLVGTPTWLNSPSFRNLAP